MLIQIGTLGYKDEQGNYIKNKPLTTENTEELSQAKKNLLNVACDMFVFDLVDFMQQKEEEKVVIKRDISKEELKTEWHSKSAKTRQVLHKQDSKL